MATLEGIERMLRTHLGSAFMSRCPALTYEVNAVLMRFGRTPDPLPALLKQLDSLLFNAIYVVTEKSMTVTLDNSRRVRVRSDDVSELADRLLGLAYAHHPADAALQDALYDFAREGSYTAMRELLARFPLEEFDRAWITNVLSENQQLR